MEMINKTFLIFIIFLLVPTSASAKVLISEVMYDLSEGSDSGREWVEVFNSYSSSIILTEWKLYENETNHKISEFSGGDSLTSGSYAIIADNPAKFLADWPSYSGQIFDSAFSLKNSGETLIIRDSELIDIDTVSYLSEDGASGDGNTLQRSSSESSALVSGSPTPGVGLLSVGSVAYKEADEGGGSEEPKQTPSTGSAQSLAPEPQVYAYLGEDRDVIVGADTLFKARALDGGGNLIEGNTRYIWNFGDGDTDEGESVVHVWKHPGRYVLVLDVAYNKYAASDKIIVTAHSAEITISTIESGDIALSNNGSRDLNISFWHLQSQELYFTIPENTFLLAGETVRFSKETTRLSVSDDTALLYPNGTVVEVATKEEKTEETVVEAEEFVAAAPVAAGNAPDVSPEIEVESAIEMEIDLPVEQAASAAAAADGENDFFPSTSWIVGLILFVGLGALGAAAARSVSRDEYTIIEED